MFTSEPSLAQRIERMIGDVPIVDTRSDLAGPEWHAPDLAALLAARPIRLVLSGVGMPTSAFGPTLSVDERVTLALPFLRQVRSTSAAWCLFRIFRDLYDFDEPHLTLANYPALRDRVAQAAADPDRARRVICDRAKVRLVVAPLPRDFAATAAPTAPEFVAHRWDLVATEVGDATPEQVRSQVFDQLDRAIEGSVRFAAFDALPDLANPVHQAVLAWHSLHQAPLQILLDAWEPAAHLVPRIVALAETCDARLSLMTGRTQLGPDVVAHLGRWPHVFFESSAGWGAWPAAIETQIPTRIQQVGLSKIGGFASGATTAEWVYGALQATRKATATALAHAVSSGFFEEDEIPPLLRAVFNDSPVAWYRLPS